MGQSEPYDGPHLQFVDRERESELTRLILGSSPTFPTHGLPSTRWYFVVFNKILKVAFPTTSPDLSLQVRVYFKEGESERVTGDRGFRWGRSFGSHGPVRGLES